MSSFSSQIMNQTCLGCLSTRTLQEALESFLQPTLVFVVGKVTVAEQLNSAQNNYKRIMKQYVISLWFEKKLFWTEFPCLSELRIGRDGWDVERVRMHFAGNIWLVA